MAKYIYQAQTSGRFFDNQQREAFLKNEMLAERLSSMKQDRLLRLCFSFFVLIGVGVYVGFVVNIIYKCGHEFNYFQLDTKVAITLLTTTTANIVALLVIVVRYLFPSTISTQ